VECYCEHGNECSGSVKSRKVAAQVAGSDEGLSSVELVGGTESQQGLLHIDMGQWWNEDWQG
jgi:hypothetical protein